MSPFGILRTYFPLCAPDPRTLKRYRREARREPSVPSPAAGLFTHEDSSQAGRLLRSDLSRPVYTAAASLFKPLHPDPALRAMRLALCSQKEARVR